MNDRVQIGLIDDDRMARYGLTALLARERDMSVAFEASSFSSAVTCLSSMIAALVMEIALQDHSGWELLRYVHVNFPTMRVLVLTALPLEECQGKLLEQGASSVLPKSSELDPIRTELRNLVNGERVIARPAPEPIALPHERLSARETAVFHRLASGEPLTAIANAMNISVKTVCTYRRRLLEKMEAKTNGELTIYAIKHGFIKMH